MSFPLAGIPAVKRMKRNNPPAGFYPKIQLNAQKTASDCLLVKETYLPVWLIITKNDDPGMAGQRGIPV